VPDSSPIERLAAAIERAESEGAGWIDVDSLSADWPPDDRDAVTWYAIAPGSKDLPAETRTLVRFEWASFPSSAASFGLFVIGKRAYVCLPPDDGQEPWTLVQRVRGADDHGGIGQAIKDLFSGGRPGGSVPMSVQVDGEFLNAVRDGLWACCDIGGEGDVGPRWTWDDLCNELISPDTARLRDIAPRILSSTLTDEDKQWVLDNYLAQAQNSSHAALRRAAIMSTSGRSAAP
jgi:hypothetical protein